MRILLTGGTGQDGSYLSELLLQQGHEVFSGVRHSSVVSTPRIEHLRDNSKFHIVDLDLLDSNNIAKAIAQSEPDEIYNLAAQSHVKVSYSVPEYTGNVNALGALRILEALIESPNREKIRFYQASTSELFGPNSKFPQNEETPLHPRSPYGIAKLYSYWMTKHHRDAYGLFASNGILFNHESPRRPKNFVTRKISSSIAKIVNGTAEKISLGDLDAKRDWGHSKDYVEAMTLILRHDVPDDFVISSGNCHSVRDFVQLAFDYVGIKIKWKGSGLNEVGLDSKTGKTRVDVNPLYFRPGIEAVLMGDSSKAHRVLNWRPKISFEKLVSEMVESDLNNFGKGIY